MENQNLNVEIEFSDAERLKLQQLQIRQALATASNKNANWNSNNEISSDLGMLAEGDLWRLIPENTSLYDWQKNCLKVWLNRNGRGTVKVATGGGKTLFALAAAQELQNTRTLDLRMAIVVPTIPLMNQWRDELSSSNLHPSQIGLLGGGNKFEESENLKIIVAVLNSAREKLPKLVDSMEWKKRFLLVVDECHRSNAEEARKIFNTNPSYTLGLSATPEVMSVDESEPDESILQEFDLDETNKSEDTTQHNSISDSDYAGSVVGKALGEIIFDYSLKDCMEAGLLTKFDVFHVGLELNKIETEKYSKISKEISELRKELQLRYRKVKSKQKFIPWCQSLAKKESEVDAARFIGLANERKRLLYGATSRMDFTLLILKAASMESVGRQNNSKTIVFHESISDINMIYCEAERQNLPIVLEHSKLKKSVRTESVELFRSGISKTIISARSLVEGFNVPSADIGIIAASSSSIRQRIQSLGRMLRINSASENAKIFVLYIRDTEDEAIYEKADWEEVLGAERNQYFHFSNCNIKDLSPQNTTDIFDLLEEKSNPPRKFRPHCKNVDASKLRTGENYPGQTYGTEVRVDDAFNLNSDDGRLYPASMDLMEAIIKTNKSKRAIVTPCGHLICRNGSKNEEDGKWTYIGTVESSGVNSLLPKEKFKITKFRGKDVIARKIGGVEQHAHGVNTAKSESSGKTLDYIWKWHKVMEAKLGTKIKNLYWDGKSAYWIEFKCERFFCDQSLSELEFPNRIDLKRNNLIQELTI